MIYLAAYTIAALGFLGIWLVERFAPVKREDKTEKPMDGDWMHICSLLL